MPKISFSRDYLFEKINGESGQSEALMLIKTNFAFTYKVITILTITSLLPLAWIYSVIAASGLTYFVDKTNSSCSDAGNGLTAAQPFCSIGKGASVAVAGDTLRVLAGSYAETVSVPKSGSVDLPITYSAEPGVTITGNGSASGGDAFQISSKSYVIIDGFNIINTADNGIYISGSNHITISNNHVSFSGKPISGSTRQGIYLTGTTDSTISGNTTDHNTQDGIRLSNGAINNMVTHNISFANAEQWQRNAAGIHVNGSGSYNNTLIHNITYANEDTGLQFYDNAHNNSLIGNLTYGNGDHGIDISNAPYNTAIGNTVQGNHTSGINYEGNSGTSGSSGAIIMNNVSVDNGIAPLTGRKSNIRVDASSIPGTSMDYNLVYYTSTGSVQIEWNGVTYATLAAFKAAVPGQEVHGLQSNPRFIAPVLPAGRPPAEVIGDYHVAASSPVIDSAYANAMNETLLDLDGNVRVDDPATADTGDGARTYDDRGAFEFQQGGLSTAIPTVVLTATPTATPNSTMSFIPIADAHVRLARPTTNYGTNTSLMVAGGTASYESYLKFTVSGLNNTVKSATLRLYVTNATVDGPAAFGTDPNWTETGLTWNNRPAITSIGMDDKGIISANSWVEFNVTPLVTADGTYSFALIGSSTDGVTFSSRQGSQVPQLVISTINGSYTSTPITTPSMTPTSTTTNIPTDLTSTTPTTTPTIIPPTAISSPTSTYIPTATYTTTATNPPLTAITFLPNADTYARLSGPTTNYGTSTVLYVAGGTASYETYIKFSISGISGIVNNATLRLYASNGSVDGPAAFGTDPNWTETGLTWNNRPAITSIGMDDKGIISANSNR
jgi:parallel beta-helix repeat protein